MATVLVIIQLSGRFFSEIIRVRNIASHFLALGPMTIWERIIERRLREETSVVEEQFGFMTGRSKDN